MKLTPIAIALTTLGLSSAASAADANLVAVTLSISTSTLKPNYSTVFTARIRNSSPTAAAVSTAGIYWSRNATISKADTLITSYGTPRLNAYTNQDVSIRARTPRNIPAGTCYLGLWADHLGKVKETDDTDNIRSFRVTGEGKPDMTVTEFVSVPSAFYRGRQQSASFKIKNDGGVTAPSFFVAIYLSQNSVFESGLDTFVTHTTLNNLGAGSTYTMNKSFTVPANTPLSHRYMIVVLDQRRLVSEINETNNQKWARTTVKHRGTTVPYGTSCRGTNGSPIQMLNVSTPWLRVGSDVEYRLSRGPKNFVAAFLIGGSRTRWGSVSLPLTLPGTTCRVQASPDIILSAGTDANGSGKVALSVPNMPQLIGQKFYTQFLCRDLAANVHGWTNTIGFTNEIGSL